MDKSVSKAIKIWGLTLVELVDFIHFMEIGLVAVAVATKPFLDLVQMSGCLMKE